MAMTHLIAMVIPELQQKQVNHHHQVVVVMLPLLFHRHYPASIFYPTPSTAVNHQAWQSK
jgi:hypothetical protein